MTVPSKWSHLWKKTRTILKDRFSVRRLVLFGRGGYDTPSTVWHVPAWISQVGVQHGLVAGKHT